MRKPLLRLLLVGLFAAMAVLWLTRPRSTLPEGWSALVADAQRGAAVFDAGGCASCHAAPDAGGDARQVLSGGQRFPSPYGTFTAPNISPSPQGIGSWTAAEFYAAMHHGTSPDGRHYYPAFPYASYARATAQDIVDLHAFLLTLPGADTPSQPHDLPFPFNIRAGLGLWKVLFLRRDWVLAEAPGDELARGRYLVEALGHCGECHSPRGVLGNMRRDAWLAGAPDASGKGRVPNITPGGLGWSAGDIAYYLETGFTPDYDSAGGHMAAVVANFARLPASDRAAVAAYLKAIPAVE